MILRFLVLIFLFAFGCFSFLNAEEAGNADLGKRLFKNNCSGCHLNGQNLIKAEKPIIGSLKLKSKEAFKEHITSPPPPMPSFKKIADNEEELNALYDYVRTLKE